jgi:putative transposase
MTEYRRLFIPGGSYFFTVVTYQRRPIFSEPQHVDLLREAFKHVMGSRPFTIDAIVILPDHLHCLWQLPENDDDFSGRWREIKKYVSKRIGADGKRPREKDVWHVDYIHYNPVKHGLAMSPAQWPYSSFRKSVAAGWYDSNWGCKGQPAYIQDMEIE